MMRRSIPISIALVAVLSAPALASFGGGSPKPTPPPSQPTAPGSSSSTGAAVSSARSEAEASYALAYEEVAKAKKDLADGKTKNAEKKFKKALDRGENAVALAPDYHEAWNLVGYCARKPASYDRSIEAYEKCLSIKSDYAPAREYLGEAWLDRGDAGKAREQLALLERMNAGPEAAELKTAIAAWETAHPSAAAKADSTGAAPADSSAGGGGR